MRILRPQLRGDTRAPLVWGVIDRLIAALWITSGRDIRFTA
jgi:hypothetical protein